MKTICPDISKMLKFNHMAINSMINFSIMEGEMLSIVLVICLMLAPLMPPPMQDIYVTIRVDNNTALTRSIRPGTPVGSLFYNLQDAIGLTLVYRGDINRRIRYSQTLQFYTRITRQANEIVAISYEIDETFTPYIWRGDTIVQQQGQNGELVIATEITYIGGEEYSREVVKKYSCPPVNKIALIGTGRLGALADVTSPDFRYVRRVRMEATAYTAGFSCTGKRPGDPWYRITASGREVEHGIVAVDRRLIPLGTRLYVEGYGFALAADVVGAIRGYKIDLFMENLSDALRFGRRHLYVWILDEI